MRHLIRIPLFKNVFALVSAQISSRLIRFIYIILIARILGPEEVGIYLYGIALYLGVMSVTQFGQATFLGQRLGYSHHYYRRILSHSFSIVVYVTPLIVVFLLAFVFLTETNTEVRLALTFLVASLLFRAFVNWSQVAGIAMKNVLWILKYELLFRGGEAVVGFIMLYYFAGGLLAVSVVHFLFWGLEAMFIALKMSREHPQSLRLGQNSAYMRLIFKASILYCVCLWAENFFHQFSIILLRNLGDFPILLGNYTVAMQCLAVLLIVPFALTQNFLPDLSYAYRHGQVDKVFPVALKLMTLVVTVLAILAVAYGSVCMTIVFGKEYGEAPIIFRMLGLVYVPYVLNIFTLRSLTVLDARKSAAGVWGGMLVLHGLGMQMGFANYQLYAVVGSMFIASIIGVIVSMVIVTRRLGIASHQWWLKLMLTAASGLFLIYWEPLPGFLMAPLALLVVIIVGLLFQIFEPGEFNIMYEAIKQRRVSVVGKKPEKIAYDR